MTISEDKGVPVVGEFEVTEVDESVLKDLESKYINVICPVHGVAPSFELQPDGSIVERMCCESLRELVRELQIAAGERSPSEKIG